MILRNESLVCISSSIELSHKSHAICIQCAQIIENLYAHVRAYVLLFECLALITYRWRGIGQAFIDSSRAFCQWWIWQRPRIRDSIVARDRVSRMFEHARISSRELPRTLYKSFVGTWPDIWTTLSDRLIFKVHGQSVIKQRSAWSELTFSRCYDRRLCERSLEAWAISNNLSSEQSPPVDPR